MSATLERAIFLSSNLLPGRTETTVGEEKYAACSVLPPFP